MPEVFAAPRAPNPAAPRALLEIRGRDSQVAPCLVYLFSNAVLMLHPWMQLLGGSCREAAEQLGSFPMHSRELDTVVLQEELTPVPAPHAPFPPSTLTQRSPTVVCV